jgi:hypothetical protein
MILTERYLKAVAAQLPKGTRDDIVAEQRGASVEEFACELIGAIEAAHHVAPARGIGVSACGSWAATAFR